MEPQDALQEAIARRRGGSMGMQAGGGVPAADQFSAQGQLRSGGSASPVPGAAGQPTAPAAQATQAPAPSSQPPLTTAAKQQAAGTAQVAQSPAFTDKTRLLSRELAKSLIDEDADQAAKAQLLKRLADLV